MASPSNSRQIRDVMTANPRCVTKSDPVRSAAKIMKDEDTGVVPVVDGKKIIGVVTDRDIVVRLIAEGKESSGIPVSEVMSTNVQSVKESASVDDALALMARSEIRRIPVVNDRDELVGIASIGDISMKGHKDDKIGQTLKDISEARPNN